MKKGIVLGLMLGVFGLSGVGLQQYTYAENALIEQEDELYTGEKQMMGIGTILRMVKKSQIVL